MSTRLSIQTISRPRPASLLLEIDLVAGVVGDEAVAVHPALDLGQVGLVLGKIELRQVDGHQVAGAAVERVGIVRRLAARAAQQRLVVAGEDDLRGGAGVKNEVLADVAEEFLAKPSSASWPRKSPRLETMRETGTDSAAETVVRRALAMAANFAQAEVDGVEQRLRRLVVAQFRENNGRGHGVVHRPDRGRRRRGGRMVWWGVGTIGTFGAT